MVLSKGLVQVYTGNGKGKTTAALGQALRAVGRGLRVYMIQFLKTEDTGEIHSVQMLNPKFKIFRFENPRGFFWTLKDYEKLELKEEVRKAFEFCKEVFLSSQCDILILDEIMGVISNGLLPIDEVIDFINSKPLNMELIMTGRDAPLEIINVSDLVTEMREIKHYYNQGVGLRQGIEY